jgi:hypothetical protein
MTVVAMCVAAIALFLIGVIAAKNEIAEARGPEKIVALRHVCFAIPLAVFGALHLFGPQFVMALVGSSTLSTRRCCLEFRSRSKCRRGFRAASSLTM